MTVTVMMRTMIQSKPVNVIRVFSEATGSTTSYMRNIRTSQEIFLSGDDNMYGKAYDETHFRLECSQIGQFMYRNRAQCSQFRDKTNLSVCLQFIKRHCLQLGTYCAQGLELGGV
jgi:hypothetical protein